uniref:BTB domain-containing protein n=2 Tax=Lepeophtheirus salmonis TaxID=72036 RepID=A0A0K2TCY9_LEPSM
MLLCHNGNHGKDIVTFMDETRRRRMFEDVKIICKDSAVLWAHAAVLGCLSPFLKSLLIVDSPEEDSSKTLVLPDVHSSVMKKTLEALYKGNVTLQKSLVDPILNVLQLLKCETPCTELKESPPPLPPSHFHPSTLFVQTLGLSIAAAFHFLLVCNCNLLSLLSRL